MQNSRFTFICAFLSVALPSHAAALSPESLAGEWFMTSIVKLSSCADISEDAPPLSSNWRVKIKAGGLVAELPEAGIHSGSLTGDRVWLTRKADGRRSDVWLRQTASGLVGERMVARATGRGAPCAVLYTVRAMYQSKE
jgi:hypothetical protein